MKLSAILGAGCLLVVLGCLPSTSGSSSIVQDVPGVEGSVVGKGSTTRALQTGREYDIGDPDVSYSGFRLTMAYTVRDQITPNMVESLIFRDGDCLRPLDAETAAGIKTDIIPDNTSAGNGSGTRTMSIALNFDPTVISSSRLLSITETQGILSMCIKFQLLEGNSVMNELDSSVTLGISLESNVGIIELINEDTSVYDIVTYECDDNDVPLTAEEIANRPPLVQGETIQICAVPDDYSIQYGVILRSINSFSLLRGDLEQKVLIPNGVIVDYAQTRYVCEGDGYVCRLKVVVDNQFFHSAGSVTGTGTVVMQYQYSGGFRRSLVRNIQLQAPPSKAPSTSTISSTAMMTSAKEKEEEEEHQSRRLFREAGGIVGTRPFDLSFRIAPSSGTYKAEVFECDSQNRPLQGASTKELGGTIRVCVRPDVQARNAIVFMRSLDSFQFKQNGTDVTQFAVEAGGRESTDGRTFLLCYAGDPVCVFKTQLREDFFKQNNTITGRGEVILQYGQGGSTSASSGRRQQRSVMEVPALLEWNPPVQQHQQQQQENDPHHRQTQLVDPGFAGSSEVSFSFFAQSLPQDETPPSWEDEVEGWWVESPVWLRLIYILIPVLLLLCLFCCLFVCFCGCPGWCCCGGDKDDEDDEKVTVEHSEVHITRQSEQPLPDDEDQPAKPQSRRTSAPNTPRTPNPNTPSNRSRKSVAGRMQGNSPGPPPMSPHTPRNKRSSAPEGMGSPRPMTPKGRPSAPVGMGSPRPMTPKGGRRSTADPKSPRPLTRRSPSGVSIVDA